MDEVVASLIEVFHLDSPLFTICDRRHNTMDDAAQPPVIESMTDDNHANATPVVEYDHLTILREPIPDHRDQYHVEDPVERLQSFHSKAKAELYADVYTVVGGFREDTHRTDRRHRVTIHPNGHTDAALRAYTPLGTLVAVDGVKAPSHGRTR